MNNKTVLISFVLIVFLIGCSNQSFNNKEYKKETETINYEIVNTSQLEPLPPGTKIHIDFLFSYIYWDNKTYEILLDQEISKSELNNELGKVKRYISSEYTIPTEKFENTNGDSNLLRIGTSIYKIKGESTNSVIAVEYKGKYYIARAYK